MLNGCLRRKVVPKQNNVAVICGPFSLSHHGNSSFISCPNFQNRYRFRQSWTVWVPTSPFPLLSITIRITRTCNSPKLIVIVVVIWRPIEIQHGEYKSPLIDADAGEWRIIPLILCRAAASAANWDANPNPCNKFVANNGWANSKRQNCLPLYCTWRKDTTRGWASQPASPTIHPKRLTVKQHIAQAVVLCRLQKPTSHSTQFVQIASFQLLNYSPMSILINLIATANSQTIRWPQPHHKHNLGVVKVWTRRGNNEFTPRVCLWKTSKDDLLFGVNGSGIPFSDVFWVDSTHLSTYIIKADRVAQWEEEEEVEEDQRN